MKALARKNRLKKRKFRAAQIYNVSNSLQNVVSAAPMMKNAQFSAAHVLSAQRNQGDQQRAEFAKQQQTNANEQSEKKATETENLTSEAFLHASATQHNSENMLRSAVMSAALRDSIAARVAMDSKTADGIQALSSECDKLKASIAALSGDMSAAAQAKLAAAQAELARQEKALQDERDKATAAEKARLDKEKQDQQAAIDANIASHLAGQKDYMAKSFAMAMKNAQEIGQLLGQLKNPSLYTSRGIKVPDCWVYIYMCNLITINQSNYGGCHEVTDPQRGRSGFVFEETKYSVVGNGDKLCGIPITGNIQMKTPGGSDPNDSNNFFYWKVPIYFVHWLNNLYLGTNGLRSIGQMVMNPALTGYITLNSSLTAAGKIKLQRDIDIRIYALDEATRCFGKIMWHGLDDNLIDSSYKKGGTAPVVQLALSQFIKDLLQIFLHYLTADSDKEPDALKKMAMKEVIQFLKNPYINEPIPILPYIVKREVDFKKDGKTCELRDTQATTA